MRLVLWLVLVFNAALVVSGASVGPIVNAVFFLAVALTLLFGTLRLAARPRGQTPVVSDEVVPKSV